MPQAPFPTGLTVANGEPLVWGRRTYVMGIINVTDDSFSGDGLGDDVAAAVAQGLALQEAGADIITTNTFATARHVLDQTELRDAVRELNTAAVELAQAAREAAAPNRKRRFPSGKRRLFNHEIVRSLGRV